MRHRPPARAHASHPHADTASLLTCGKADVLARQTGIHHPENARIQRAGWGVPNLPHMEGPAAKIWEPTGPALTFNPIEWTAFTAGIRAREFD